MDMPGYLDHGKMLMMPPSAYGAAQEQLGLAQLFQAEKQKQAESKTLADMMANDQSREMNPLLVQQQRLNNTGKDTANQDAGLTLERNKAMKTHNLNADQRAAAMKITDDQLKVAQQKIELDYMSGDPERIKRAQQGEQFLSAVRAEKRKAADEMEKVKEQGRNHLQATNATVAGMLKGKQMDINAGKFKNKGKGIQDIQEQVQLGKMSPLNAAVAFQGAAMFEEDPDLKQKFLTMAAQYEKLGMNAANAKAGTSADLSKLGIATNPVPATMGADTTGTQPQIKIQSPQDQQALNWANANPNDPRAAAIKKKLGVN